jgi:hypothetical protein
MQPNGHRKVASVGTPRRQPTPHCTNSGSIYGLNSLHALVSCLVSYMAMPSARLTPSQHHCSSNMPGIRILRLIARLPESLPGQATRSWAHGTSAHLPQHRHNGGLASSSSSSLHHRSSPSECPARTQIGQVVGRLGTWKMHNCGKWHNFTLLYHLTVGAGAYFYAICQYKRGDTRAMAGNMPSVQTLMVQAQ